MSHNHSHSAKNIKTAFFLNLAFSVFELIGGIFVNSVSIISDSIHDFGDALSIAISWRLDKKSEKDPNNKYTYGYLRFSVLGAFINATVLLIGSIIMLYSAIGRLITPQEVNYSGMIWLAVIGLLINGFAAYKTSHGKAISEKVVSLHMLEDVLGWAVVLIGSILMSIFDLSIIDPVLSILITIFILFNVARNIKKIFEVFLEKAPKDIDIDKIVDSLKNDNRIVGAHHIHIWSMDGEHHYATLHIVASDNAQLEDLHDIKESVKENFFKHNVVHTTVEIELESENCNQHKCIIDNN